MTDADYYMAKEEKNRYKCIQKAFGDITMILQKERGLKFVTFEKVIGLGAQCVDRNSKAYLGRKTAARAHRLAGKMFY